MTVKGLGCGPGLTVKAEVLGSGGSEARKTANRLLTAPEQEEAHSSGRLLGKRSGQLQSFMGARQGFVFRQ